MTPTSKLPRTAAFATLLFLTGLAVAEAGQPVTVFTDHSRVFDLGRAPATIVVGNPSIADVTISGTQILLHARSYGTTNVIEVHINRLRTKLQRGGKEPLIHTVRGRGYVLRSTD